MKARKPIKTLTVGSITYQLDRLYIANGWVGFLRSYDVRTQKFLMIMNREMYREVDSIKLLSDEDRFAGTIVVDEGIK